MLQDIKLSVIPTKYQESKDSVSSMADLIKNCAKEDNVIGMLSVVFKSDGCYKVFSSAGLERHRKIGILMEMVNELLNP